MCQASWSSGRELALLCFLLFLLTKASHKASADSSGKEVEFHLWWENCQVGGFRKKCDFFFCNFPYPCFAFAFRNINPSDPTWLTTPFVFLICIHINFYFHLCFKTVFSGINGSRSVLYQGGILILSILPLHLFFPALYILPFKMLKNNSSTNLFLCHSTPPLPWCLSFELSMAVFSICKILLHSVVFLSVFCY